MAALMVDERHRSEREIFSLGSINADFQVRVDRRPEVSETVLAHDFMRLGGGKAANVALIGRRLGRGTCLLAHVGRDDLAEQALAPLREAGVDLTGVEAVYGPTGVSMITVPEDGKKGIVLAANANRRWTENDCRRVTAIIEAAPEGAVLVLDCEVPVSVAEAAAEAGGARGMMRILDPSPAADVSEGLLRQVDVVTPNPAEAKTLTGITVEDMSSAVSAARQLLEQGPAAVCLKLPDGGCVVAGRKNLTRVDSSPIEVIDTTGAGDAFTGALAVALSENRSLQESACFAVAASRLAVSAYGSQPAYPDRDTLERSLGAVTLSELRDDEP